jgi:hypothetical protein
MRICNPSLYTWFEFACRLRVCLTYTRALKFVMYLQNFVFLGAFAKLRKRLLASSCLSVSLSLLPSFRLEHGRIFMKFCNWIFLKNLSKILFSLQSDENNGYFIWKYMYIWGRNSVVGIATRYGLDGPGIEYRWGARFSALFQTGPGAHPASCTKGTGSLSRR